VALLQETIHKDTELHITGYTNYACKCKECRGIVTYIRNAIKGDVELTPDHLTDIQKVSIWHAGGKYTIYNVYNPPHATCTIKDLHETQYHKTIIAGDINGHSPRWG
jgi:hypothetical protein